MKLRTKKSNSTLRSIVVMSYLSSFIKLSIATLVLFIVSAPIYALTDSQLDMFAENNIMFYDPGSINCPPGSAFDSNSISGSNILMIGDSITRRSQTQLQTAISGIDIVSQDSKQFGGADNNNPTGLQLLKSLTLKPIIILALGTNNASLTTDDVNEAIKLVGSNRQLIFVTNYKYNDPNFYSSNNNKLRAAAQTNSNIAIADWEAAAATDPDKYIDTADGYGVHPSVGAGTELFAQTIANSLKQIRSTAPNTTVITTSAGGDNQSVLLGFLIDNGYTHQSAAAIAGNIQGESYNADPARLEGYYSENKTIPGMVENYIANENFRAIEGDCATGNQTFKGGFGIAQWTSPNRVRNLQCFADGRNPWTNETHPPMPVISLEVQLKFLLAELASYKMGPSRMNAIASLEEATWVILRGYEIPSAVLFVTATGACRTQSCENAKQNCINMTAAGKSTPSCQDNDEEPPDTNEFSKLNPSVHRAAYSALTTRFNYAQKFLGLTPTSPQFATFNCINSGSHWSGEGFPYYYQRDPEWKEHPYGPRVMSDGSTGGMSTLGSSGCGIFSFAMMATALLNREVLPTELADIAGPGGMLREGGSSHGLVGFLAPKYGLEFKSIGVSSGDRAQAISVINQYLRDGWMIHSTGLGTTPYTSTGHMIGIRGITTDGKWLIADSNASQEAQNTLWEPTDVINAGMNVGYLMAIRK